MAGPRTLMAACMALAAALSLAQQPPSSSSAHPAAAPAAFQISGTVVDATSGVTLAHARVGVASVLKRDEVRYVDTDNDGRFIFDQVAAGKYALSAQMRGFVSQAYNQHGQYSSSIAVGPDLDSSGIVFRLRSEGTIAGKITDEQAEPIRGARVMLFESGAATGLHSISMRNATVSNDQGSYRFSHLAPGKYYLAVSASPWYAHYQFPGDTTVTGISGSRGIGGLVGSATVSSSSQPPDPALDVAYPLTFYPGTVDSSTAVLITLAAGERYQADLALHPVQALHLRVPAGPSAAENQGNLQVRESIFDGILSPVHAESRRLPDGTFILAGIAPGHYVLDLNTFANSRVTTQSSREVDASADGLVDSGKDRPLSTVSGVMKMEQESVALPSTGLMMRNLKTGGIMVAPVNAKGEFEFRQEMPVGDYTLDLSNAPGCIIKSVSGSAGLVGTTLKISGKGEIKLSVLLSQAVGRVEGIVQRDGKPFGGAMVVLVPDDPGHNAARFRRDQSDTDGTFNLVSVAPGRYTVLAIENGWELEWGRPEVLKPFMAKGEVVQVDPKGKQQIKVNVQSLPVN